MVLVFVYTETLCKTKSLLTSINKHHKNNVVSTKMMVFERQGCWQTAINNTILLSLMMKEEPMFLFVFCFVIFSGALYCRHSQY